MTNEEAERFLRTAAVRPTQTLVELVKEAFNKGYREGMHEATSGDFNTEWIRYD